MWTMNTTHQRDFVNNHPFLMIFQHQPCSIFKICPTWMNLYICLFGSALSYQTLWQVSSLWSDFRVIWVYNLKLFRILEFHTTTSWVCACVNLWSINSTWSMKCVSQHLSPFIIKCMSTVIKILLCECLTRYRMHLNQSPITLIQLKI